MGAELKKYREYIYRSRKSASAQTEDSEFFDQRDAYHWVYFSLLPFLGAEYYVEKTLVGFPSGLVFPIGFLLFWSFYYTFYKPGVLEERLSDPSQWNLLAIPTLFIGICVWFIQFTVLEIARLVWPSLAQKKAPARRQTQYRPTHQKIAAQTAAAPKKESDIPDEIQRALQALGLEKCRSWELIHKRYRVLAKLYHPDLNPEVTDVGRRFMQFDAAYKKLETVKSKYFTQKRSSS